MLGMKRFEVEHPDLRAMDGLIRTMEAWLVNAHSEEEEREAREELLRFQAEDGSFRLLDTLEVPSDARVDYCFMPTYLGTAILMKGLTGGELGALAQPLSKAMQFCTHRGFSGHGYEAESHRQAVLRIFRMAGCREFVSAHPGLCEAFTELWSAVDGTIIFVYGTLMRGRRNHGLIGDCEYLGQGEIRSYAMYDLGSYPGIVPADDRHTVLGEMYRVPPEKLSDLDWLESEGVLYDRTDVTIAESGTFSTFPGQVYVYRGQVNPKREIPRPCQPYGRDVSGRVWYVSYGSNMLEERFRYYIKGGCCPFNGKPYPGCTDKMPPEGSVAVTIPHEMYYGKRSPTWEYGGVAFLDAARSGKTLGRAWLIREDQVDGIIEQEGPAWYGNKLELGSICGVPAITLTANGRYTENAPCEAYQQVIFAGQEETRRLPMCEIEEGVR